MQARLLAMTAILLCTGLGAGAKQPVVRYDELSRPVVAAKGQWMVGGTAAYSAHENKDYSLAVISAINSVGFNVSAAPECCYFFKDNLGVGGKLSYGRTMLSVAGGSAEFGSVSIGVKDYYTVSQDVKFTAFIRYYIPIGDSRRIAFHVDAGLQGLVGHGKQTDEHTGAVVGTWQSRWRAGLVVNPGITAFFGRRTAIFASIGMAGISYGSSTQIHNQVAEGKASSLSASYLLDLTSLNVGIDFLIGKR